MKSSNLQSDKINLYFDWQRLSTLVALHFQTPTVKLTSIWVPQNHPWTITGPSVLRQVSQRLSLADKHPYHSVALRWSGSHVLCLSFPIFFALPKPKVCIYHIGIVYIIQKYPEKTDQVGVQFFPRSKKGVKTQNQTRVLHFTIPEKQKGSPLFGILLHWTDLEVDIICMKVLDTENIPLFKRSDCHRLSNSFTEKKIVACGGSQWRKQCSHKRSKWCTTKQHQHHGFRDEVPRRMEKLPHWSCKVRLESWSLLAASNMSLTLTWTAKNIRNKTYELCFYIHTHIDIYIYNFIYSLYITNLHHTVAIEEGYNLMVVSVASGVIGFVF